MGDLGFTRDECDAHDGLLRVSLGTLRKELGRDRLGKWILGEIADELKKQQMGYFPADTLDPNRNTEPRQHQTIWVYVRDNSTRARVIDAILHPGDHDVQTILDGLAGGDLSALTPEEKLKRIQEIVEA